MFRHFHRLFFVIPLLLAGSVGLCPDAHADYKDDIGFTDLQALLGPQTPTGAGISVTHVEALDGSGHYYPNTNSTQFAGKIITDVTGVATGSSSHATDVGTFYYGNQTSIAPGVDAVDAYYAGDWLYSGFLKTGEGNSARAPLVESRDVQSHSWISSGGTDVINSLRRLDYAIRRDSFTVVAGMNNGGSTAIPNILGHSYNAITVGRSDGSHSHGFTTLEEPGRVKPEIVAPLGATSYATPVVGAAAALLHDAARNEPGWSAADSPEGVKALLMAGATKEQWPAWDRTPARPLDEVYGAGEVNIFNSYVILTNGPQPSGAGNLAACSGWDAAVLAGGATVRYFFEIPQGWTVPEFSAILTWNRHIIDTAGGPKFSPQPVMPDLSLHLNTSSSFVPGVLIDLSTSIVDNVEHVVQANLLPGQYVLEIVADIETEYALAWRGETVLHIPYFTAISMQPGSAAHLTVEGLAGQPYELRYAVTPDLGWTSLDTNTPVATPFEFIDLTSGAAMRSYQVRSLDVP